jgi:hypothetical protein
MFSKKNIVFIFKSREFYPSWIDLNNYLYDVIFIDVIENRWKTIHEVYDKYDLKKYSSISFLDSDVRSTSEDLEKYIKIFNKYKLNYSSPSYKNSKFFSPKCILRNVNIIPTKFITFNFDSLSKIKSYLKENDSGSGIDWLIPKLLDFDRVSIVDYVMINNVVKNDNVVFKDFIQVVNKYDLHDMDAIEFSTMDYDDKNIQYEIDEINTINECKFNRPSRRSNQCHTSNMVISQRFLNLLENMT